MLVLGLLVAPDGTPASRCCVGGACGCLRWCRVEVLAELMCAVVLAVFVGVVTVGVALWCSCPVDRVGVYWCGVVGVLCGFVLCFGQRQEFPTFFSVLERYGRILHSGKRVDRDGSG